MAFCVRWIGHRNGGQLFPATNGRQEGGDSMVSFWWVLVAFIGGGCAGVLVLALMDMTGGLPEQTVREADVQELSW